MTLLVPLVLFGWMPTVLALFAVLSARRAVLVGLIGAWLFLPMASFPISGLPDYDKVMAASVGILLGTLLFDFNRFGAYRASWLDLPMLIWCLTPFMSSVVNGLGPYDGVSSVLRQVVLWGLPYLIGRLYFTDEASMRDLAWGFVIGGLIYVPFCLYEIRMSPQLHHFVYGYMQHSFNQTRRFDGWRPMVFMQHGLAVGMWMAAAALVGLWLWRSGALRDAPGWATRGLIGVLAGTAVLCKSLGAIVLMGAGLAVLAAARYVPSRLLLIGLLLIPPSYLALRVTGKWSGDSLLALASAVSPDRAASLETRLRNEAYIVANALRSPLFGLGYRDWLSKSSVNPLASETDQAIPDGLWVIAIGRHGMVGLAALFATFLPRGSHSASGESRVPGVRRGRPGSRSDDGLDPERDRLSHECHAESGLHAHARSADVLRAFARVCGLARGGCRA